MTKYRVNESFGVDLIMSICIMTREAPLWRQAGTSWHFVTLQFLNVVYRSVAVRWVEGRRFEICNVPAVAAASEGHYALLAGASQALGSLFVALRAPLYARPVAMLILKDSGLACYFLTLPVASVPHVGLRAGGRLLLIQSLGQVWQHCSSLHEFWRITGARECVVRV